MSDLNSRERAVDLPRLAGASILDEAGVSHKAESLWADGPALIVFVRHFGWLLCREQTVQVHRKADEFASLGARVVVIGNGPPRYIDDFRRTTNYDGELFTDPSREVYRACGFVRGVRKTLNRASFGAAVKAFRNGYRQSRTQGDPWQQGGAVIVAPPSEVVDYQRSRHAGDHASLRSLFASLEAHVAAA